MVKFTNNVDPISTSQITTITTFEDIDDANITNLSATTLDISEGINSEGLIRANEAAFESIILGDLKIQNNIISLSEESILDEIILNANKITLSSDGADINLAKISTNELEISDSLITLSLENAETSVDRGIFFNYPVSISTDPSGFRSGFIGMNSDNIFRLVTGISTITDNNFYNNGVFTLGTLEIGSLLINNINNNSSSNNLTISTSGNLNLLSTDNDNSVIIGNGLDSKTVINSNLEIKGTLEAETFAFFNSNVSTYARKNLLLFLDNSVKIDNISESNGIYTLTLNEDRVFASGGYIYFEGVDINNTTNQTYLDKFNGIHTILNVSDDFLSITIELESGLDIPSFSDDVYALIGSLNLESLTNNSGLSVLSYEDSSKELREHKINYEYDSNNYLDSSWLFNRNLKTENTILLKINKIFYDNDNEFSRIYVKDDGELYFKNNYNNEYKLTNQDNDDIFNLNNWAITNDEIVYTFNKVSIGGSTMSDEFQLSVKGDVEITGKLEALSGNLVANNIDASGSLSVNGFKSTNINTQNLTIEDRNFQIGYLDVSLINSVDEENNLIFSRIDHKLEDNTYIYFQNTNIYFSNNNSIDGFRKVNVITTNSIQIYDDDGSTISDIKFLTMNRVKYIGLKNLVGSDIINNIKTEFQGDESIRVRIFMLSAVTFKYSLDAGYTYQDYGDEIVEDEDIFLGNNIIISFLDTSNLENGDYFEFDCCPQYDQSAIDPNTGENIEISEINFLGEFGKIFPSNELLDSGFEIMIRNPNSYILESQKFSYYYTDSNDKFWRLTDTLNIVGSLNLKVDTSSINFGEDEEITLTHVHDTGLLLNQNKKLLYGSLNEYIYGDGSNLFINSSNNLNINSSDGIINIGNDNVDTNINIGTSANARTITIGADESTKVDINAQIIDLDANGVLALDATGGINIGTTSDVAIDIDSSTLDIDASGDITIDTTSNSATAININASAGGIDIDANGVLALDGTGGINIGTTSDVAIDIDSSTLDIGASGDITIDTTSNSGTALTLTTNGGESEQILIMNNLGTNTAAININASAGGIDINANDVLALDGAGGINIGTTTDVAIDIDASTLDIDASNVINIDTTNTSNGINIGTATSGVPISIGHSTSEVTINDNLNIIGTMNAATGSTIGNLTLANGSITDSNGTISFGDGSITNIGSVSCDSIRVDDSSNGLDIVFAGDSGLNKLSLTDNLADALNITEGSNSYLKFITTDSNEEIVFGKNSTFNSGITVTSGQTFSSDTVNIDGGSIDGTTIGSTSTSTGAFTTISASDLITANGGVTVTSGQTFSSNSVDIDGGSIDGTTIGSTSTSTGAFTTISASDLISANNGLTVATGQTFSSDSVDINGGTIDGVDITMDSNNILDVSNGTLITSLTQNLAIVEGASSNIDIGNFSFEAQTLTDGSASLSGGVLSGLSRIDGDINIGDTSSQLGFFGAILTSKTEIDNLDSLGSSVLDTSSTPTNDNLNDLREDIVLIHNKLDNLIDALQSLGLI